ncbi:HNH endonuclease [Pseudomonas sp. BS3767]|nr:HNH endonuclease [Pseudomonas syringae]SDH69304.1 HNH endonuclease [Pseudomonas sp. BS3767]SDN39686.1 HNH endonuclease [Pseudomonas sp. BS3759]
MVSLSVSAKRDVQLVHRLVASAFCEQPEGCFVINHIDADKSNNRSENLEWTTSKANTAHAMSLDLMNCPVGSKKGAAKLTEADVAVIIRRLHTKEQQKVIAIDFCVSGPRIADINLGKAWRHVVVPECGSPPYHLRRPQV